MLGLAYKRDIDDLRESPSLTIIELLRAKGAIVAYNDPFFPTVGHGRHYDLNMTSTPLDNLGQYDAVLIVTDHSSYDYKAIVRAVAVGRRHSQRHKGHRRTKHRPMLRSVLDWLKSGGHQRAKRVIFSKKTAQNRALVFTDE